MSAHRGQSESARNENGAVMIMMMVMMMIMMMMMIMTHLIFVIEDDDFNIDNSIMIITVINGHDHNDHL